MAHQLVAEEVERDAVVVAAGQVAAEPVDVEVVGLVEVAGRDGEVEDVSGSRMIERIATQPIGLEVEQRVGPQAEPERLERR